jgi:peptide-methionine (S)-S-oxide reductase
VDAVFKHVKGVSKVVSGYSGGEASTAQYETVSEGTTGHAEAVQVTFDPAVVPYATLLKVFFSIAHDPTTLNRQGPDEGTQYRSVIFYANADQQSAAQAAIAQLTQAKTYPRPIVTQVVALKAFYPAEAYHQDYLAHHLTQPYIVYNDLPKVAHLKANYPELYRP